MVLENICNKVCGLAKDVGKFIKEQKSQITIDRIETKGVHDFVTYVDKTAEKKLVNGLLKILPDAGFIVEEKTIDKQNDMLKWIIDPLDGTTNYIHGITPYAISIALADDKEILMGVVYEIGLNELFYAWKGSKTYLNGNEISVSERKSLSDSFIATGFPYYDYGRIKPFLNSLDYLMQNSHGVRRLGSAATDLAYVACGRFEAFYEYSLSPWDVAAGALIVQQAGGKVSDFSGNDNYIYGKEIIATNKNIFDEFLAVVKKYLIE